MPEYILQKYHVILGTIAILAIQVLVLYAIGHIWLCKCGYVKLWHGIVASSENSQHISDWYTLSHIIHGFIFYYLGMFLNKNRKWSIATIFLMALAAESAWEIWENTDFIINRYREATISLDYYGDSIINSVMDTLFMVFGFFIAAKFSLWMIIALAVAMEISVGWYIRDNLILNIIMLIYPLPSVLEWQSGG